jgi:hypothetical protein
MLRNLARGAGPPADVRPFVLFGLAALAVATLLDLSRPAGRGFLVVTRANPDSVAYFANARSLLFDHDFDLTGEYARLFSPELVSARAVQLARPVPATGRPGSPYAVGTSLLGFPAIALGTAVDALAGAPADGYGVWAERAFVAANLVWLSVGLYLCRRWLASFSRSWPRPGEPVAPLELLAALALVPATALGYYALTAMAHTASFLAVALFLLLADRYRASLRLRDQAALGAAAGFVALCRWPDALLVTVVLADELLRPRRRERWRSGAWWRGRLVAIAAAALVFAPQVAQWRAVYGRFLLVPQGEDFLEWPPRHVADALFSSWNGFFFTTPATLLGIAGLLFAARRDPRRILPLLAGFAALAVLVGAQTGNWNGHAFAQRHLIGVLPLVAAGWLWLALRGRTARVLLAAGVACGAAFTLAAAIQWRFELVPRLGRLTSDEAFADKLHLPHALARDRALRRALAADPDPARR